MFTTIAREATLTERALEQVQTLIINKSLKPGEKLPPERTLGEMLGVSRTVVREVVRLLTAKGLVEVRPGSGTYVRELGADMVTSPIGLLLRANALRVEDIHETRTALEIRIAELAAERAGGSEIKELEENLERMKRVLESSHQAINPSEYAVLDVEFHALLARATRNPLLEILVDSLNGVMRHVRLQLLGTLAEAPQRACFYHSRILEEVRKQNPESAGAVMESHLADTLMMLRASAQLGWNGQGLRLPAPQLPKTR